MPIRPYAPADLPALYAINQASTPGVGHEDNAAGLGELLDMGSCLVAADEAGTPQGFINLIEPGETRYPSDNLRWLERWMADEAIASMIYVDRIAIDPAARGQQLGEQLYKAAFARWSDRAAIGCEVNDDPPNPGSRRFHERLGFRSVGTARYRPDYAVRFFVRALG